jgi:hypothetical protein
MAFTKMKCVFSWFVTKYSDVVDTNASEDLPVSIFRVKQHVLRNIGIVPHPLHDVTTHKTAIGIDISLLHVLQIK